MEQKPQEKKPETQAKGRGKPCEEKLKSLQTRFKNLKTKADKLEEEAKRGFEIEQILINANLGLQKGFTAEQLQAALEGVGDDQAVDENLMGSMVAKLGKYFENEQSKGVDIAYIATDLNVFVIKDSSVLAGLREHFRKNPTLKLYRKTRTAKELELVTVNELINPKK